MKAKKTSAALLAAALLAAATACGDTETEWVTAPTVSATQAAVQAGQAGGSYTAPISVSNPVEGAAISAASSASWVEVTSCTEAAVGLSVSENPNPDPRTARVTVSYSYTLAGSKGTASCEFTVAQGNADQPILSVQPTAVAVAIEGGSYSFQYEVVNPASDGEVSASCNASWISGIDCSKDGEVSFSASENTGGLRQTTITLSYAWSGGSLSETVTVVQDHEPDASPIDDQITTGTYTCSGNNYYYGQEEWTLRIFPYDSDYPILSSTYTGAFDFHIDGIFSDEVGDYEYYGNHMVSAGAYLDEDGALHIPTQVLGCTVSLSDDDVNYEYYWLGYTPCVSSSSYTYSSNWPDLVFTWDEWDDCWYSDYGMFFALYTYEEGTYPDYSTDFASSFIDCVFMNMKLVKESTDIITITSASEAAAGAHKSLSGRKAVTGMTAE